jgi:hypothetical protein
MQDRPLFPHTLKNVGNTCFLNSALQAIASLHPLVESIMLTPVPHDHSDDTYCLVLLQLFLPAIAVLSPEQNKQLVMSSVQSEGRCMNDTDWSDFVDRLTKYDPDFSPGRFADPGDLINYILSLTPEAAFLCVLQFQETLPFAVIAQGAATLRRLYLKWGSQFTIPVMSHLLNKFSIPSNQNL